MRTALTTLVLVSALCTTPLAGAKEIKPPTAQETHDLVVKNGLKSMDVKTKEGLRIDGHVKAIRNDSFDLEVQDGKYRTKREDQLRRGRLPVAEDAHTGLRYCNHDRRCGRTYDLSRHTSDR